MSFPSNKEDSQSADVISRLKQAKEIWEILVWVISAGTVIVSFVKSTGGLLQFLVEVGTYGIACYIAVWVILPVALWTLAGLEQATSRRTTDLATGITAGIAVLGGGALIRWKLIHSTFTEDLDTIGIAFSSLLGVAVLAAPFIVLWYFRGSKSHTT